jgi:hypothetical protein
MLEQTPEQDAVARVLHDWLISHGYTLKDGGRIMVSTDTIREDLVEIRADNPSPGNTAEGRRWNRAVDKMFSLVDYYERVALREGSGDGRASAGGPDA